MSQSTSIYHYGSEQPLPEQRVLRAGPLTMLYENGDLRYIRLGEHEIVRRLYVAVRDRNWGTVLPQFSNVQFEIGSDSFAIRYDVTNQQNELDFRWHGEMVGDSDGTIRCSLDGKAHSTFLRNRIGFCLLHPMAIAGARARIEHVDGTKEDQHFPLHIAQQLVINGEIKPVIPFNEMRAIAHEVTAGQWAEVRFAGETFEMEDQRNWTDASYKTYGTPLRLPFPVEVQAGTQISQSVTIRLLREDNASAPPPAQARKSRTSTALVAVEIDATSAKPLPRIGLGVASHGQPLNKREIERLRALNLSHLRLDLRQDSHLAQPDAVAKLRHANQESQTLGVPLEIALHLSAAAEQELADLRSALAEIRPTVATWLIFYQGEKTTSGQWVQLARKSLAAYDPNAKIGAGTNAYFTELNSRRPEIETMDVVAYSLNPQVHAFDNSSLVETLAAQAATATSARQFCGTLPLHVSPITLQPRYNPNATGPEPEPKAGTLPSQVDVRQMSLFGAGWTLGSIKQLAATGEVASLTYYETTGWRGVMEQQNGSPLPEKFRSIAGGVFPLYHVFADIAEFAGGDVLASAVAEPLAVEALALHKAGRTRILLANLTGRRQRVRLNYPGMTALRVRTLDETNVETAMRNPTAFQRQSGRMRQAKDGTAQVELLPYALVKMEITSS